MKIGIKINFFEKTDTNVNHLPRPVDAIAYNLSEELVRRGHLVTAFVTSDSVVSSHIPQGAFNSQDPDVILCRKYYQPKDAPPADRSLLREHFLKYLKRGYSSIVEEAKNLDIIHTHEWNSTPIANEFYNRIKRPIVTTFHGSQIDYAFHQSNRHFVAISQAQQEYYPGLPFIGTVYNGLKIEDFEFSATPDNYLAYLGRITPDKGTLEAIKVAQKTNRKLIIAGQLDSEYPKYVANVLDEITKDKNIAYVGPVNKDAKNKLLKNASAFLMPIQWEEPFGMVVIEALACGTPVVAFNRGSMKEIVTEGESGFLVTTVDEMAAALSLIPSINRQSCRNRVEKYFTVAGMVDHYEKIYEEALSLT